MTQEELDMLPEKTTDARLTLIDTAKIEARDAEIARLRAALRAVLHIAKRACGEHPSDDWRAYDAAKALLTAPETP